VRVLWPQRVLFPEPKNWVRYYGCFAIALSAHKRLVNIDFKVDKRNVHAAIGKVDMRADKIAE